MWFVIYNWSFSWRLIAKLLTLHREIINHQMHFIKQTSNETYRDHELRSYGRLKLTEAEQCFLWLTFGYHLPAQHSTFPNPDFNPTAAEWKVVLFKKSCPLALTLFRPQSIILYRELLQNQNFVNSISCTMTWNTVCQVQMQTLSGSYNVILILIFIFDT